MVGYPRTPDLRVRTRSTVGVVVIGLAAASGAGAVLAPGEPTGLAAVDAVLRAVVGTGLVPLAARAGGRATLVTATLAAAASLGSAWPWAALAAFGLSATTVLLTPGTPLAGALSGALVAQAVLRLPTIPKVGATAVAVAVVVAPVAVSAWRRTSTMTRGRLRAAGATLAVATAFVTVVAVASTLRARPDLEAGLRETNLGLAAAGRGDVRAAGMGLRQASSRLAAAEARLGRWWARPALGVPLVGPQLRAVRTMASSGARVAATGAEVFEQANDGDIGLTDGAVELDRIVALRAPLARSLRSMDQAREDLVAARSAWLLPAVGDRLSEMSERMEAGREQAATVELAARIAPSLLGSEEPRRYFLAIQNPAEMRATGGIIGNFGEISVSEGRLRLTRLGRAADLNLGGDGADRRLESPPEYVARYADFRPEQVWQNVNVSPDFPTVARVIADLYPRSGGQPLDGVISVDPTALAALLAVVGPVEVPGWPEPLTAANTERILLHEQYLRYPTIERVDFLGNTAAALWSRLTTGALPGIRQLASALGPAADGRHVMLWSRRAEDQRLFERLGVDGSLPEVESDFLAVVTQNASGNKIDWFLRRSIDYRARMEPSSGAVEATLTIRLENDAPDGGLPPLVIAGSGEARTRPGENQLYLSVYTPWALAGAEVNSLRAGFESQLELGRRVYSTFLTVPPGGAVEVVLRLSGTLPAGVGYGLDVGRQVTIRPDRVATAIESPPHG